MISGNAVRGGGSSSGQVANPLYWQIGEQAVNQDESLPSCNLINRNEQIPSGYQILTAQLNSVGLNVPHNQNVVVRSGSDECRHINAFIHHMENTEIPLKDAVQLLLFSGLTKASRGVIHLMKMGVFSKVHHTSLDGVERDWAWFVIQTEGSGFENEGHVRRLVPHELVSLLKLLKQSGCSLNNAFVSTNNYSLHCVLLEAGANPLLTNRNQMNALQQLVRKLTLEHAGREFDLAVLAKIDVLLAHGVSLTQLNSEGQSAIQMILKASPQFAQCVVNKLKAGALDGDDKLMAQLGSFYNHGYAIEKDTVKAQHWYNTAVLKGNAGAMLMLAELFRAEGGPGSAGQYQKLVLQASNLAYEPAMYSRAMNLLKTRDDEKNVKLAVELLKQCANCGFMPAFVKLAWAYRSGAYGQEKNPQLAFSYFIAAAEQGFNEAQAVVANEYIKGIVGGFERNITQHIYWAKCAAANGRAASQLYLARCYLNGDYVDKNVDKALMLLELAANKGYVPAIRLLGAVKCHGVHVPRNVDQGMQLLRQGAALGDAHCYYALARFYRGNSWGMPVDHDEAFKLATKAATLGLGGAQDLLAFMYRKGQGTNVDLEASFTWTRRAAVENNFVESKLALAECYLVGLGTKKDINVSLATVRDYVNSNTTPEKKLTANLKVLEILNSAVSSADVSDQSLMRTEAVARASHALEIAINLSKTAKSIEIAAALLDVAGPAITHFNINGVQVPRDEIQARANPLDPNAMHIGLQNQHEMAQQGWGMNVHQPAYMLQGMKLLDELVRRNSNAAASIEMVRGEIQFRN